MYHGSTEYYNPFSWFFKEELEDIENDKFRNIDTVIFECKICGLVRKLNNKELEDVIKFLSEYDLKVYKLIKYIELIENGSCKNGDDHQFNKKEMINIEEMFKE